MKIKSSQIAHHILKKQMIQDVEELWCLALGPGLQLLNSDLIFRGTVDSCTVHPRDIFRFACKQNASQIIIAHNHPSGDPRPSAQDIEFTSRLVILSHMIEIPLIDHLILTKKKYLSMADTQIITFKTTSNCLVDQKVTGGGHEAKRPT